MPADLTIEQLAAQTGMTVRNIRAHQARGLLDAARGARCASATTAPSTSRSLRLIQRSAGRRLQPGRHQAAARRRPGHGPAPGPLPPGAQRDRRSRPQTLTVAELGRRFRVSAEEAPEVLARAETLGVLVAAGEGRFEVPSPSLLAVAEQVVARGVSLNEALTVFKQVELHCDAVSAAFVSLFMREVWEPFEAAGMPTERWAEIDETIARLRPLATEALVAIFGQRMSAQIDAAFGAAHPAAAPAGRAARPRDNLRGVTHADPEQLRALTRETWETAAAGWGKRADRVRNWGMPVSVAMVESLELQPGQRVLELAAGPGDTGFMAAELVRPGARSSPATAPSR